MRKRLVLVSIVLLTMSGCSIGSPVPDGVESSCGSVDECGGWTDFDGMVADWTRTAETLDVPPGEDMRPPERGDFGGGEQEFTARYGESIAHSQWFCLWEGELLAQPAGAPEGERTAAIEQLRLFLETRTFAEDYGADVGMIAMVDEAAAGDLDRVRRDHEANCGHERG